MHQHEKLRFSVKWLPAPYNAWCVLILDEVNRRGLITAYYCNTDDVDLVEDEDRGDLLTVKGEPVAEIHHRYVRADAVGATMAREAA